MKGITIKEPPKPTITKNGVRFHNPNYINKDKFEHYYNDRGLLYNENLADLLLSVKSRNVNLIKKVCSYLNTYFDDIFVDEFQDFRECRYKLIVEMSKYINNIMLVGDYYQHSVSGTNNSGMPFKKNKEDIKYDDFLKELKKLNFDVDDTSLSKSRRCGKNVSDFVCRKMGIKFSSYDNHDDDVIILNEFEEINEVLRNDKI